MSRGSWSAVVAWAIADLRSRWRSIATLGLLAGVTAGLALAALDGARRTDTALDRLRAATEASDAIVFASQAGTAHPDWGPLERQPEVRELATWALVFGKLEGEDEGLLFAPVGDAWLREVDPPVVVEGRMFDPAADDEMVLADQFAAAEGVEVGETYDFSPFTEEQLAGEPGAAPGPDLTVRVVGIVRTPLEALFVPDGFAVISPGVLARHPEVAFLENAVVQLEDGPAGVPALEASATEHIAPGAASLDLHEVARRVTTTTDVERTALLLLAAAIALAGLVLVGQVLLRSVSTIGRDAAVLSAVGMGRRSIALAPLLSHALAAGVGAVACVATATVASRWLPVGLARRLDPDLGVRFAAEVVLPGAVALVLVLVAGTYVAGWRAVRPERSGPTAAGRGVSDWVRQHASPAVGIGATMAFRSGSGRRAVPVRPALVGAVVGVLGVATAMTMDAGLRDALDHPERAGVAWDLQARAVEGGATPAGLEAALVDSMAREGGAATVAAVDAVTVPLAASTSVIAVSLQPLGASDPIELVTIDGRGPRQPGQVALGPATADELGVEVGDVVDVGEPSTPLEIVGLALFPNDVHAGFDGGAWLHPDDFGAIVAEPEAGNRYYAVRLAPDADHGDATEALRASLGETGAVVEPAPIPPELSNLRNVLPLPKLLAAFLALLAIAALLHVLATTTRVRAHDFAVLRAIGVTRRGTRAVVNVQGTAVFVTGLVLGIPLGIALGRTGWGLVADSVPLDQVAPFAVATVVLVPAGLVAAQVVALAPGRRVARLRAAEVLRTE